MKYPQALHAALQKLEEGGSLEDAKAVCEPGLLNQMVKWKVPSSSTLLLCHRRLYFIFPDVKRSINIFYVHFHLVFFVSFLVCLFN